MAQGSGQELEIQWPEPKDFTFRCPFCGGAVVIPIEINGFTPIADDKWNVVVANQMTSHDCGYRR